MVEVLIEDFGYEALGKPVTKPLEGIKIAGYVDCQANRSFGIDGDAYENPMYLDKLVATLSKCGFYFHLWKESAVMSVAYGKSSKEAGLVMQIIPAK